MNKDHFRAPIPILQEKFTKYKITNNFDPPPP